MDAATTTALAGIFSLLATEAFKSWGPLAFLAILPAVIAIAIYVSLKRQLAAKDAEIKALRDEKEKQLLLRLESAEATMRLAKSGTETMAARSEGDQAFRDLLVRLTDVVSQLREDVRDIQATPPPRPRRPSR